ncbi:hypothetical protein [Mammaliicoccus sciuri]|uniref:hypothetical protein n=1 Tax=Mammaliicoccus sciuri TaxID=1296 RepID=UPI000E680266|nr:hypothetical protein [Mammaliicoccus sciuri]RIO07696.1 hypothetical protein BUZ96_12575 [Mammaliicoccus sciuri]
MGFLFAMCDNCNAIYNTGIKITNSSDIKMEKNSFGKCDICEIGNVMSVDGLYSEIDNVMSIVAIDEGKDLEKLYNILKGVTEDTSIDEIEDKINKETPQYKRIVNSIEYFFTKTKNTLAAAGIVGGLIFGVSTMYTNHQTQKESGKKDYIIDEQRKIIEDYKNINKQNKRNNEKSEE